MIESLIAQTGNQASLLYFDNHGHVNKVDGGLMKDAPTSVDQWHLGSRNRATRSMLTHFVYEVFVPALLPAASFGFLHRAVSCGSTCLIPGATVQWRLGTRPTSLKVSGPRTQRGAHMSTWITPTECLYCTLTSCYQV